MAATEVVDGAGRASLRPSAQAWATWMRWFVLCVAISGAWGAAVPKLAGPDEQTHVTKAAAVARGQLAGQSVHTVLGQVTLVDVAEIYSSVPARSAKRCYAGTGATPASCAGAIEGSSEVVQAVTYVGTYPPAYYLIVGLPTRFTASPAGIAWMRAVSVVLGSALLASAFASASIGGRRNRLLLGTVLATTPMVWYLIGVVNPNGLEIAGALSAITAVVALGGAPPSEHGRLLRRAAVGFAVCSLVRTPSLGFAVLAVALGWIALGSDRPRLADLPGIRIAGVAVAATAALAIGWALTHATGGAGDALTHEAVRTSIGESGRFVRQAIGDFGELDTPLPWPLWAAWAAVVGVLALGGFASGTRSQRSALGLAIVGAVGIPIAFQALAVAPVGANWQGRYGLPALVCIPVLAGLAVPRRADQPIVPIALATAIVVHGGALFVLLRRYQVGVDGPVWFVDTGTWRTPIELGALLAIGVIGWVALAKAVTSDAPPVPMPPPTPTRPMS